MFYDPEYGLFFVNVVCTFEKILFSAVAGWIILFISINLVGSDGVAPPES